MSDRPVARLGVVGRRRLVLGGVMLVGGAGLGACVPGLPGQGPGPREFRLTPKTTFSSELPRVGWALAVAQPAADRSLDTDRIALIKEGLQVQYVADARWSDRAPAMLQGLIVGSFAASGAIATVGTDRDRLSADFLLRSSLPAFNLLRRTGAATVIRVRLDAQLLGLPDRELVGSESFAADATPTSDRLEAVIEAFDEATGDVLKRLVVWTLATGQSSRGTGA
jgi:cholesterol transport system auxiliary component